MRIYTIETQLPVQLQNKQNGTQEHQQSVERQGDLWQNKIAGMVNGKSTPLFFDWNAAHFGPPRNAWHRPNAVWNRQPFGKVRNWCHNIYRVSRRLSKLSSATVHKNAAIWILGVWKQIGEREDNHHEPPLRPLRGCRLENAGGRDCISSVSRIEGPAQSCWIYFSTPLLKFLI